MKAIGLVVAAFGMGLLVACPEASNGEGGWKDMGNGDAGTVIDAAVEDVSIPADASAVPDGTIEADGGATGTDGGMMDTGGGVIDAGTAGDAGGAEKAVGAACASAGECPAGGSGTVACETAWPDGYCLVVDCAPHGHDCPNDAQPGGGKCVDFNGAKCLAVCASGADCRTSYDCVAEPDTAGHGDFTVCVPQ